MRRRACVCLANDFTTRMPNPTLWSLSKSEGRPTPSSQTEMQATSPLARARDPNGTALAAGICVLRCIGNHFGRHKSETNGLVRVEQERPRTLKVDIAIGCDFVKVA